MPHFTLFFQSDAWFFFSLVDSKVVQSFVPNNEKTKIFVCIPFFCIQYMALYIKTARYF